MTPPDLLMIWLFVSKLSGELTLRISAKFLNSLISNPLAAPVFVTPLSECDKFKPARAKDRYSDPSNEPRAKQLALMADKLA
ncbi:MAG: hypothetical protein ABW158_08515 [Candidatus Thiodiazotropha sp. 6PDIVS]